LCFFFFLFFFATNRYLSSSDASLGSLAPYCYHDNTRIRSLGTSATNHATCSESPSVPTSSSLGLCSTRSRADPLIWHVYYNYLLPASILNATRADPLRCDWTTSLLPASIAIENRLQQASVIRTSDILWLFVSTRVLPESAILESRNRGSWSLLTAMALDSLLPAGRAPVHFTAGSSQRA
jgi:hypothetical protein